jgi:hypothetical protein
MMPSGTDPPNRTLPFGRLSRATAKSEDGHVVTMYHNGDGELLTYEELAGELDVEAASIPAENWRDGEWDVGDYIIEACLVGIYQQVNAVARVVTRYTDGTSAWTVEQMRDEVFPGAVADTAPSGSGPSFENWIAESTKSGAFTQIAVVEYTAEDYDEGDEETVVAERLVTD